MLKLQPRNESDQPTPKVKVATVAVTSMIDISIAPKVKSKNNIKKNDGKEKIKDKKCIIL